MSKKSEHWRETKRELACVTRLALSLADVAQKQHGGPNHLHCILLRLLLQWRGQILALLGDACPTEEYVTVKQQTSVIAEPPPSEEVSFPVRSFGYATQQYWAFLEALLNGLRAYEAQAERREHAPTPLPAA
jgi:hypothetical protein